jgi:septal ring factor EnvC (AmiA/AmiB activator)
MSVKVKRKLGDKLSSKPRTGAVPVQSAGQHVRLIPSDFERDETNNNGPAPPPSLQEMRLRDENARQEKKLRRKLATLQTATTTAEQELHAAEADAQKLQRRLVAVNARLERAQG